MSLPLGWHWTDPTRTPELRDPEGKVRAAITGAAWYVHADDRHGAARGTAVPAEGEADTVAAKREAEAELRRRGAFGPDPAADSAELAGLLPDLPYRISYARQAAHDAEPLDAAILDLARACELLLAERADVTARPLAALRAAFSDVDPHSATVDMLEARHAAAMWEARYRESEEARTRDAAVLRALRGEVERLRAPAPAPAPAGGTDREAELDRIAAMQRERMRTSAVGADLDAARGAAPVACANRFIRFEDPITGEYLYRRATPEEIAASEAAPDLAAARAAAREARERAADVPPCEFSVDEIGANDDRTWVFAEIYSDFHKGRYLYLRAPADVVDTTPGECFAHAIMAARSDVPTLAAHVDTLANEAERLRASAPAGGADREAELDRIAAAQQERMGAIAAPSDDMPDPDAFDPDDAGDTVAPEDADRAELIVSLLRRSTAELRALVALPAPAADLDAARAAAKEARRWGRATPGPWSYSHGLLSPRVADEGQDGEWKYNGRFIAAARTGWPECAAHVDTLANETERLRARVAELEAESARPEAQAIETMLADEQTLRNWLRGHGYGPVLDAGRSGVEVAIGLLSAPAGWRVAALLAAVSAAAGKARETALPGDYADGKETGLVHAADLITAHLGAPSPLDGVVAEVLAVDVAAEVGPVTCMNDAYFKIDDLASVDGTEQDNWRDLVRVAAVALAGIRACDVLPTPMLSRSQMIARGMHNEVTEMDRKVSKKAGPHG